MERSRCMQVQYVYKAQALPIIIDSETMRYLPYEFEMVNQPNLKPKKEKKEKKQKQEKKMTLQTQEKIDLW